jgi:hypothetical protein
VDYYQGVVVEYLRATRSVFVNTECLIQLVPGDTPERGLHWYCDAVAVNLQEKRVYLCEISYSQTLSALLKRLEAWRAHWPALKAALVRECSVGDTWPVQPWLFVPEQRRKILEQKFGAQTNDPGGMPPSKITDLESVAPWHYRSWNGKEYAAAEKAALRSA